MTDRLLTAINAERDAHKAQIKALTRDVIDATPEARETYLETVRASEWARIETEDAYKESKSRPRIVRLRTEDLEALAELFTRLAADAVEADGMVDFDGLKFKPDEGPWSRWTPPFGRVA